jgi:hypothetical protein
MQRQISCLLFLNSLTSLTETNQTAHVKEFNKIPASNNG